MDSTSLNPESFLGPEKQRLLLSDVQGKLPGIAVGDTDGPARLVARGRKRRGSSPRAASQTDWMANTSASSMEPFAGASEQPRPQKRYKRSSSTPAVPRRSHLSTRPHSHRRSRLRADSPTPDAEYVRSSRVSARLARKIHPFSSNRSIDIYLHLAGPDGAGNLLNEPPACSVMLNSSNEVTDSLVAKQPRGRRRKKIDLTDDNAKKDLMEEWARLRQSQGALPLSGVDENACYNQELLGNNPKGDDAVSLMHPEAMSSSSSNLDSVTNEATTITSNSRSQETLLDISLTAPFPAQADSENAVGTVTLEEKLGHKSSVLPFDGEAGQPSVLSTDVEALSTSFPRPGTDKDSLDDKFVGVPGAASHPTLPQYPESCLPPHIVPVSPEDSSHVRHLRTPILPPTEQTGSANLDSPSKGDHPASSQTSSFAFLNNTTSLDSDEEFYMLDISEVFTIPWVPVASHLYVPPGLGKLISGMREQLTMEARARRRAEELHQAELSRRISAEKMVEDLRVMLEEKQKSLSAS